MLAGEMISWNDLGGELVRKLKGEHRPSAVLLVGREGSLLSSYATIEVRPLLKSRGRWVGWVGGGQVNVIVSRSWPRGKGTTAMGLLCPTGSSRVDIR